MPKGLLTILAFLFVSFPATTIAETKPSPPSHFSTLQGLGFDKQASIWLVEKHITLGTPVQIISDDADREDSVYFDEPGGKYFRDAEHSTYEKLLEASSHQSDYLSYFKTTVFDIEINLWQPDSGADSKSVENAFRSLQEKWGRTNVPHGCYREFFDQLEVLYGRDKTLANAESLPPKLACWREALTQDLENDEVLVTEMPINELLGHMRSGAKVLFVDVREPDEFSENHIPGALNLQLRDANAESIKPLEEYDLVVSYCVKDFRGFEMARKLRNLGIKQSAILNPYGIKGWIESNMPVYTMTDANESAAIEKLKNCVDSPAECQAPQQ